MIDEKYAMVGNDLDRSLVAGKRTARTRTVPNFQQRSGVPDAAIGVHWRTFTKGP
jgi:hypothetical protein